MTTLLSEEEHEFPDAREFSPGRVNLRKALQLVDAHEGDSVALIAAVGSGLFPQCAPSRTIPGARGDRQKTRARNLLAGMENYGLYDPRVCSLTERGKKLLGFLKEDDLADAFALHVLQNCHGMEVLNAIRDIQSRSGRVTRASLSDELTVQGFQLPRSTERHTNRLMQWLRNVGILDGENSIDEARLTRLMGCGSDLLKEFSEFSIEQRTFLLTVREAAETCRIGLVPLESLLSRSEWAHGYTYEREQLLGRILGPLEVAGWIRLAPTELGSDTASGRVAATWKLLGLSVEAIAENVGRGLPDNAWRRRDATLATIRSELTSGNEDIKRTALELLAIRMASDLGLTPLRFGKRNLKAGIIEVALFAEAAHLHYSRWLFRCWSAKAAIPLTDLEAAVGIAVQCHAQVIVIASTAGFCAAPRGYARQLVMPSGLQAVLVDQRLLERYYTAGPRALVAFVTKTLAV